MTNATTILEENLRNFLLNDLEELRGVVSELNCWNGSHEDLEVHHNDEDFFNTFFHNNPLEAVRAVHFGEYNYNDDFVKFNAYGNLESLDEYEHDELLKSSVDDIVENLMFNIDHINVSDELEAIIRLENELDELIELHETENLDGDEIERYKDLAQEVIHADVELPFELLHEHE